MKIGISNSSIASILSLFFLSIATISSAETLVGTPDGIKGVRSDGYVYTLVSESAIGLAYDADNEKLYFVGTSNTIKRADRDGNNVTTIVPNVGSSIGDLVIDPVNNRLIWTQLDDFLIASADLDGGNVSNLVTGVSGLHGLSVDANNNHLYYTDAVGFSRVDLDGTNQTILFTDGSHFLTYFFIHGGKVYWSNFSENKIKRANLDGSSLEVLASGSEATKPEGIGYDNESSRIVYVTQTGSTKMRTMELDGTDNKSLADVNGYDLVTGYTQTTIPTKTRAYFGIVDTQSGDSRVFWTDYSKQIVSVLTPSDIESVAGISYSSERQKVYYADNISGSNFAIKVSNPDGTELSTVATIAGQTNALLVDDKYDLLYVTNSSTNKIMTVGLDSPYTQTSLIDLGTNNIPAPGLSFYNSDKVLYGYTPNNNGIQYIKSFLRTTPYTVSSRQVVASGNNLWGLAAYDSDKIAVGSGGYAVGIYPPINGYSPLMAFSHASLEESQRGVIGIQNLDPDKFETPLAIYYGYNHKIYLVIPHANLNDNLILPFYEIPFIKEFLTLGANEETRAIAEASIAAVFPSPSPSPTPDAGGKYDVAGKVNKDDSGTQTAAASGKTFVRLKPTNPAELTTLTVLAVPAATSTLTDSNGNFSFNDVIEGEYEITIEREDVNLSTDKIIFTTGESIPDIEATTKDLESLGCTAKDRTKLSIMADGKAGKIVALALSVASSAFDNSQKQSELSTLSDQLNEDHKTLMEKGELIPKYELICNKQSSCTKVAYKAEIKNYKKAVGNAYKTAKNLIKKSLKGNALIAKLQKLDELKISALQAAEKLPAKSYDCPTSGVDDDFVVE